MNDRIAEQRPLPHDKSPYLFPFGASPVRTRCYNRNEGAKADTLLHSNNRIHHWGKFCFVVSP